MLRINFFAIQKKVSDLLLWKRRTGMRQCTECAGDLISLYEYKLFHLSTLLGLGNRFCTLKHTFPYCL
jgi:hypothetical protein